MRKITACLWFDGQAEDAAKFYVSVFPNSQITSTTYVTEAIAQASGNPAGAVLTVFFELDGREFMALNGGPYFKLNEAVSFMVPCKDQAEVDRYWSVLSEGGETSECGWLKDRFGLSWQVVPTFLSDVLESGDKAAIDRVTKAMLQMQKLDIAALRAALEQ